ncbi:MAG: glycosyltransferase family 2 protein [Telmatospirillum sp.]|nr:glycosyltransferase family 2 protein [Telmatospirillum sp.]
MPVTPPVVLIVFSRPAETRRVFEAVRAARPERLLIIADAPRPDRAGEAERCAEVRRLVEAVDWPCAVERTYADVNMGCGRRIASGLAWAFERVEEAIVLEDDCLPDPSFFPFCAEMLDRYRDDPQVMLVSGDNFHGGRRFGGADYFFSRYHHIWGWATWRRAWARYDFALSSWPRRRDSGWLASVTPDRLIQDYWRERFDAVHRGDIDTWDYQWLYSAWEADGLCIVPNVNLIANIGFGPGATHTVDVNPRLLPPLGRMDFPLPHPATVRRSDDAARHEERTLLLGWRSRLKRRLRGLLTRT